MKGLSSEFARPVLAVDFGTTNTYLCKCPGDELLPSPVDLSSGQTGLDTAILRRPGRAPLIGPLAMNTWGEMTPDERRHCTLACRFKPDIARSREAWESGRDFLATILEEAAARRLELSPAGREVYFGVPCDASEEYRQALADMAAQAGYGVIQLLEEPLAALLTHLSQRDIAPSEALKRVLVLDFGGGTCDMALMEDLKVRRAWGDWELGGRVFDDLFFQILLDRSPGLEERLEEEEAQYFVHWYWSRQLKESFSNTIARDRRERWSGSAGNYGSIRGLFWEEFLDRARHYQASEDMKALSPNCPGSQGPEDLLKRLERLFDGIEDPASVILAGGSSQWPFVTDMLEERFPGIRTVRSDQPYSVVARGLAIMPALRRRNERASAALAHDRVRFLNQIRCEELEPLMSAVADDVSSALWELLRRQVLAPQLQKFSREGGSLEVLNQRISAAAEQCLPEMEEIFRRRVHLGLESLNARLTALTAEWFRSQGIRSLPLSLSGAPLDLSALGQSLSSLKFPAFNRALSVLDVAVGALAASVTATVCGGAGAALIMDGPLGLALGGLIGAGGYMMSRKRLMKRIRSLPIPAALAAKAMTSKAASKQLVQARQKVQDQVYGLFEEIWSSEAPRMNRAVAKALDREIAALSLINHIDGL